MGSHAGEREGRQELVPEMRQDCTGQFPKVDIGRYAENGEEEGGRMPIQRICQCRYKNEMEMFKRTSMGSKAQQHPFRRVVPALLRPYEKHYPGYEKDCEETGREMPV